MKKDKKRKFRKTVFLDVDVVKVVKVEAVENQVSESELINTILREKWGMDENFL